ADAARFLEVRYRRHRTPRAGRGASSDLQDRPAPLPTGRPPTPLPGPALVPAPGAAEVPRSSPGARGCRSSLLPHGSPIFLVDPGGGWPAGPSRIIGELSGATLAAACTSRWYEYPAVSSQLIPSDSLLAAPSSAQPLRLDQTPAPGAPLDFGSGRW